jgi:sugar-specific transcriptional regulator TrmB
LSQEKILQILNAIGFAQVDSRVYLFLSKKGAQRARSISDALKLTKNQLYSSLKSLEHSGVISVTFEHPARFSVVPFEQVLDVFVKAKMEEAQRIQQSKNQILSDWRSIELGESEKSSKFMIIEGRNVINSKIRQMVDETKKQLSIVTTATNFVRYDQMGLFDSVIRRSAESKARFRVLTELTRQNVNVIKSFVERNTKSRLDFEGRTPDLGLKLSQIMVVRDNDEVLLFITPNSGTTSSVENDVCLWTNNDALTNSFDSVFKDLWSKSIDFEEKFKEIETGKPSAKTIILNDALSSRKKYEEILQSACQEVLMVTSSEGIVESWDNREFFKELSERGVSLKIMAPITEKNLEASHGLAGFCEVRHVSNAYLRTTIIDGEHFFQTKNPLPKTEQANSTSHFENAFYTNDVEYVEKAKNMLNSIWKNAYAPSKVTLKIVTESNDHAAEMFSGIISHEPIRDRTLGKVIDEKPSGTVMEKDVMNKIINAKKEPLRKGVKSTIRLYGSAAMAIIRAPDYLNLPEFLVNVMHNDKHSSFGAEDWLLISQLIETSEGRKFAPVAHVTDNSKAEKIRKAILVGTPAENNSLVVTKDELQIPVHGNTLFAAWKVQIPLLPSKYTLPPSCILFEGYGEVKSGAYTKLSHSGRKQEVEYNRLDAFPTFFHPSTKYAGPGTDGCFFREVLFTSSPQSDH